MSIDMNILDLPPELQQRVFDFLPLTDFCRSACTCRKWSSNDFLERRWSRNVGWAWPDALRWHPKLAKPFATSAKQIETAVTPQRRYVAKYSTERQALNVYIEEAEKLRSIRLDMPQVTAAEIAIFGARLGLGLPQRAASWEVKETLDRLASKPTVIHEVPGADTDAAAAWRVDYWCRSYDLMRAQARQALTDA